MGMSMILVIVIAFSGLKKCKVDHDILSPLSRQSFLCNNNKCLFTEGEESPQRKPLHARGNGREKGGKGGRKEGRKEGRKGNVHCFWEWSPPHRRRRMIYLRSSLSLSLPLWSVSKKPRARATSHAASAPASGLSDASSSFVALPRRGS